MKNLTSFLFLLISTSLFAQSAIILQPGPAEGKDARIFNLDALANYGNDVDLVASQLDYSGEPGTTRSIFQFDLSSLPKGVSVVDARLSLYHNGDSQTPGHTVGNNAAYLRRLIVPWEESTVAWNQQPAYTTENEVIIPASANSTEDYLDINVTELVKDMTEFPSTSHGFMFMLQDETGVGKSMKFYSSDGAIEDKRPRLVVTYSTGVATKDLKTTSIKISPNPFDNTLSVNGISGTFDITILDQNGTVVSVQKTESVGNTVSVEQLDDLIPGMYYIRLAGNETTYLAKALKTE